MRISWRRGAVKLRLNSTEVRILAALLDELDELVEAMAADDEATSRLFPSAHRDDAEVAGQFRALTEEGLRDSRRVRTGMVRAALPPNDATIEIADDDQTAWLTTLNDLRLMVGTRIGVTEDEHDVDLDADDAQEQLCYQWLTALQDGLVRAVMR